jgi:hypothetical protein
VNRIVFAVLTCLIGTSVVQAQVSEVSSERIGVYGSGSFAAGERVFVADDDDFLTNYKRGGKFGVRFSADFSDRWAGELSYSVGRNNLRVNRLDPPRTLRTFRTVFHQFAGNGSLYFRPVGDELRPFITLGLTLARFNPTNDAQTLAAQNFLGDPTRIGPSTKLGINFGGGFEAAANEWLGIRVDLKDHVFGVPRFGLPEEPLNPGGVFYPISGAIHNIEVGVGAVFYLR